MNIKSLVYVKEDNICNLVKCLKKDEYLLDNIPHQPGEFSNAEPYHGQICNPDKYGDYYNYYKGTLQLPTFKKNIVTPFTHIKIKKYSNKTLKILNKPKLSIWPHYNIISHIKEINYDIEDAIMLIFKGGNIWSHFMIDVLPYINFCKDTLNNNPNLKILLENSQCNYIIKTIINNILDISNDIIFLNFNDVRNVKNLYLIETVGPYASGLFPYQAYGNIPIILYKKLHDNLTKNVLNLERNILIYNYRNTPDTKYRKIMNEIDVEKILKKYCIDNNLIYVNFYCNNYTLKERIELFRKAKIVVAPHGGANYHIYFSSKYTKFIEFIFVKDCHSCQLQALSFDLDYWQIPISDHGQFEKIITIDTNALNSLREILEK